MGNEEQAKFIAEEQRRRREDKVLAIAGFYHQTGEDLDGQGYQETVDAITRWPDSRIETEYYKLMDGSGDVAELGEELLEEEMELEV